MRFSAQVLRLICQSGLLVLFASNTTLAGIENRPLNTDEAFILDRGTIMTAFGYTWTRGPYKDRESDLNLNLGYGIFKRLEITSDFPVVFLSPEEGNYTKGFGDIAIRPELFLLDETSICPATSTAFTLKFDTGRNEQDLGSGGTDYGITQLFSKTFNRLLLNANVGYTFVEHDKNTVFWGGSFEYELPIFSALMVVGEIWGETPHRSGADDDVSEMLFGFIYELGPHCNLDFGAGYGLMDPSVQCRLTSGVTVEF